MFGHLKRTEFKDSMRSLSAYLGLYYSRTGDWSSDGAAYNFSLLKRTENTEHRVQSAREEAAALRNEMNLLLDYFDLEIVTLHGKKVQQKKVGYTSKVKGK